MNSKAANDATAFGLDSVRVEFVAPDVLALFTGAGLISQSVAVVHSVIHDLIPPEVQWRLTISGDMVRSVHAALPREEGEPDYTLERGSNLVVGRTRRASDGSFEILLNSEAFLSYQEDSDAEIERVFGVLRHLGAHEANHVLTTLRGEEAAEFQELGSLSLTESQYRPMTAVAIEEFRIELAANKIATSAPSRARAAEADLSAFKRALNDSHALYAADPWKATQMALTGVAEFVKSLGYLAAELDPIDPGVPLPSPIPSDWDTYVGDAWKPFHIAFRSLPDSSTSVDVQNLATVNTLLCRLIPVWLSSIVGLDFAMDEQGGGTIYWTREAY